MEMPKESAPLIQMDLAKSQKRRTCSIDSLSEAKSVHKLGPNDSLFYKLSQVRMDFLATSQI